MKSLALRAYASALSTAVFFAFSTASPAATSFLPANPAIDALKAATGGKINISFANASGQVNYLSTDQSRPIPLFSVPGASAETRAMAFISGYGKAFGINDAKQVKAIKTSGKDEVGMEHVRLQQLHKGIPVAAGEMTVHLRNSSVLSVLSKTLPGLETLDITPQISSIDAEDSVRGWLKKRGINHAALSKPRLEIFNKGFIQGSGNYSSHLAWFIEAKTFDVREYIWIDAKSGAILLNFNQMPHARNRKIYDGGSLNTLPGSLVRSEGQAATGDADADFAYLYAGHTYDYFKLHHGRDSYDGFGAPIISTVHHCPDFSQCPFQNAFWNGEQMVYGDGFSVADDVDAHELTHAVTENSAGLFYYTQSGALNESFSDIFGETVDLGNHSGNDTLAVRWLMGENVPGIGAIRNMKNPNAFNDPAKVIDTNFKCDINDNDQGGVHSNSGVPNHAYQLMVDGGTFNGQKVIGIGLTKAEKIEYRALTQYLTSGATFLDDFNALQSACTDLIGTAGITAANCAEVKKALIAVQMNSPVCSKPAPPPLCPVGTKVKSLFFDGFEASGGNFVTSDLTIWGITSLYAKTGFLSAYGRTLDVASDSHYKMRKSLLLPANARMQFDHAFEFEITGTDRADGGIVEYSTNNGASWTSAGALMTAGIKYNGAITVFSNNPLAGKLAFTGDSFGYRATQINLASLAGKSVRFRFRMGSDGGTALMGWFIDNVQIYQCQ